MRKLCIDELNLKENEKIDDSVQKEKYRIEGADELSARSFRRRNIYSIPTLLYTRVVREWREME